MDRAGAEALLRFAEEIKPGLRGYDANALLAQLEGRYGELQAAFDWFVDEGRTDEAFRLADTLILFWMATKRLEDGTAWLDRALAMPGGAESRRGRALFDAGYVAFWQGNDAHASELTGQALEVGRRIGDPTVQAIALANLARIAARTDLGEARRLALEALAVSEGTDEREGRSHATHLLGVVSQMSGDLEAARGYMTSRIEEARAIGNVATVSSEAGNLSMVERQAGNLDRAEALVREALEIDDRRGDELSIPWKLNGIAAVSAARGDFERSATTLAAADALLTAQGAGWPPDELVQHDETAAILAGGLGPGELERLRRAGAAMTAREAVDFALGAPAGTP